ncbi:MAG: GGDEF domain-containing protein, partial [Spirochaetales bacterium]|nr:GGDEF domain-containing protein [Spirochaetales bacterium]
GPTYVGMKASRMGSVGNRVIIGINNVEEQMKAAEAYERIKEEKITYSRITALSGNYLCIYTVDPDTDHYTEYSSSSEFEHLGLEKQGDDFFARLIENGNRIVFSEDLERYSLIMTKKNIMQGIEQNGIFLFNYRLLVDKQPKFVSLRAAIVNEADGPKLIVGICDIDSQVRRDLENDIKLQLAQDRANIDALTGVRNKHAYIDFEEKINSSIRNGEDLQFAITVFDVDSLKEINDRLGHKAGDLYLQKAARMICDSFKHSPVFRVGGDEFVAFSRGHDYEIIDEIFKSFGELNLKNEKNGDVVVSFGMARYKGEKDIADVFDMADKVMYKNKQKYKKKS